MPQGVAGLRQELYLFMPTEHPHQGPHPRNADVLPSSIEPGLRSAMSVDYPAQITAQAALIAELRAQGDQLRAERDRLLDQQRRIAELLECKDPSKLVHDLRNVLNELLLYKHLAEATSPKM